MLSNLSFKDRSLIFARLSAIAYLDDTTVRTMAQELGFTDIEFYNKSGAQAYRFENAEDIVIACRGTEPSELNDIKADLRALPVMAETIGRVHIGFKSEVDQLWPQIKEDLTKRKLKKLWFTGHSLGAAMTTIMASRCEDDLVMPNIEEVYTYGSPRVGWSKYVASLNVTHHRWVNNNDIVTRVPMRLMGFVHHGTEHYMNSWGNVRKLTLWQRTKDRIRGMWSGIKQGKIDNFSDHSMTNYIANLERYQAGMEKVQA
jgi:triacylglycerol lipase